MHVTRSVQVKMIVKNLTRCKLGLSGTLKESCHVLFRAWRNKSHPLKNKCLMISDDSATRLWDKKDKTKSYYLTLMKNSLAGIACLL